MNVSFLDDRVSFFAPLIHISFSCTYSLPLSVCTHAPPLLPWRDEVFVWADPVRSQSLRGSSITLHFNYTEPHSVHYNGSNMLHYLQHMCYCCGGFWRAEQVYLQYHAEGQ